MSWRQLLELIADELGPQAARQVEVRARVEMQGVRVTISARQVLTPEVVEAVAPGRPREAAKQLGVHPSTAYRALRRSPLIR